VSRYRKDAILINSKLKISIGLLLAVLAIICIYIFKSLMVKSLATGDLKSGLGDINGALKIESFAQIFQLSASIFTGLIVTLLKMPIVFRIVLGLIVCIASFCILFVYGF
jgi:hypothetical protein